MRLGIISDEAPKNEWHKMRSERFIPIHTKIIIKVKYLFHLREMIYSNKYLYRVTLSANVY